jgi:hypothetical protein
MFSTNCRACGHPLLSHGATSLINRWMTQAVAVFKEGSILKGEYDGYERIGGYNNDVQLEDASVYHRACYDVIGKPMDFAGRSQNSDDQGWFFNDGDHDLADPRENEEARKQLALAGELKVADITKKRRAAAKLEREFYDKEHVALGDDLKCPKCSFTTAFVVEKREDGLLVLMVRCPNRECNVLRPLKLETQAALRKLIAENPNQHCIWDDDEVNAEMAGIRSAKNAIKQLTADLEKSSDASYREYLTEELEAAKKSLLEEEKKLASRS